MDSTFKSSKKCPNCGEWSDWEMKVTDTCQHCGALLSDRTTLNAASRKADQEKKKGFDFQLIEIYPTDSWFMVAIKRIIQAVQISFMAIISFILWLLALLAG